MKVLEQQSVIGVLPCACRRAYHSCDYPLEVCLYLGGPNRLRSEAGQSVSDPAYATDRVSMRIISVDEAIHVLSQAEAAGLVHITENVQNESLYICNCCRCCCVLLRSVTKLSIPFGVAPSSFWAVVEEDECNGCEACISACPVGSISLDWDKNVVFKCDLCGGDPECVKFCSRGALTLKETEIASPERKSFMTETSRLLSQIQSEAKVGS